MEHYDFFYPWVPAYLRYPVLLLLFLVTLSANGVFLGNTTETFSTLGVYTEHYTAAFNAMYIGMGVGLMLHARLKMRFAGKPLLLYGLTMVILMNLVCATTSNPIVTIMACLILGFTKISAYTEIYVTWLQLWSDKFDTSRVYPFVYLSALGGTYAITWLTTVLAYQADWRYAYIWVIILLLVCLACALLFVEHHPLKKRIPLYQLDWLGAALLMGTLLLLNYAAVYGKVEDYLASPKITGALFAAGITLLLFLKRELVFKRPVLPLDLFTLPNFRMGIVYFILMNIFIPTTFQSAFSLTILHYETYRSTEINLYLVPGVLAGAVLCYYWYRQHYDEQLLILFGFIAIVGYHILMYERFGGTFTISDFWLPSLVKGFAITVLYISVGLYITSHQKLEVLLTVPGIAILVRSVIGSGGFTAFFTYWLYAQRIRHLSYLGGLIDNGSAEGLASGSLNDLNAALQLQATASAAKALTGDIIIAGVILIIYLVFRYLYHRLNHVGFFAE